MSVPTGIAMEIPHGYVGLVWDKSSVSFKQGLKVMGGVIDAPYRGEIVISLYNTTDQEQTIEKGKKVAQMLIQKVEHCTFEEVDTLSDTTRGENGWEVLGNKKSVHKIVWTDKYLVYRNNSNFFSLLRI